MKRAITLAFGWLILFVSCLCLFDKHRSGGIAQAAPAPFQQTYCNIPTFTVTATGQTAGINISTNQCWQWVATYNVTGFSAVSFSFQQSPDNSTWTTVTPTAASPCTNPATNTTSCTQLFTAYDKYVRIAYSLTGTGSMTARAYGSAGVARGGSGGSSGATGPTGPAGATGSAGPTGPTGPTGSGGGGGSAAIVGTAQFVVSGGVIGATRLTGVVSSVTRTSLGIYVAHFTGLIGTNYNAFAFCGDNSVAPFTTGSGTPLTNTSYAWSYQSTSAFVDCSTNNFMVVQ